jgi:hypothetical protein
VGGVWLCSVYSNIRTLKIARFHQIWKEIFEETPLSDISVIFAHRLIANLKNIFTSRQSCLASFQILIFLGYQTRFVLRGKKNVSYQKFKMKRMLSDNSEVTEPDKSDKTFSIFRSSVKNLFPFLSKRIFSNWSEKHESRK